MAGEPLDFPQEEADIIFDELSELRVELDDDPLVFGPKRLNAKTSQVRRMLDRCERLFLSVSRKLQGNKRALRVADTELDLAKKDLFANDPVTRAGRSVSDREAIASGKLEPEIRRVHDLNIAVDDLGAVMTVIKAKRADLKDTEGRLRDQMRLCSEEIGLGGHWGSKVPNAPEINGKSAREVATSNDVLDLDNILQGVDGEIKLSREEGSWLDPGQTAKAILGLELEPKFTEDEPVEVIPSEIHATFIRRPSQQLVEPAQEAPVAEAVPVVPVVEDPAADVYSVVAHQVSDMPDMGVDVTNDLPSTTTADDVDIFLTEVHMDTRLTTKKVDHDKAVGEIDLDSILDAFESI